MLEVFLLLGFLLVLFLTGVKIITLKAMILLLLLELFSMPGLWLVFRRSPPFVPTPKKTMKTMLELAKIKPKQTVYDLGCGDGRLLIEAANNGAKAIGYEFSVFVYVLACLRTAGKKNIEVRFGDFWRHTYKDADVIFCYLLTDAMEHFRKKIWPTLKPGCRVVSHCFKMKDVEPEKHENGVYVYVKN